MNLSKDGKTRKRTLIIGKNGTCKTTLLRCIAIGLCDEADGNALLAEDIGQLIGQKNSHATIEIELISTESDKKPYKIVTSLKNENDKDIIYDQEGRDLLASNNKFVVYGYGVGRSTAATRPEAKRTYRILDSVYTLFEYGTGLFGTELILRRLQDYFGTKLYEKTMKGIKKALDLSPQDKIEFAKGGGVLISGPSIGEKIAIEGWADGYRMTLSLIIDIYAWAMQTDNTTSSGGVKGILLLDELEQHMHPTMQTGILHRLAELFPEVQILSTTHSPLVALGAFPEETVALRRKRQYVYAEDSIPNFRGYSAEDMLVDDKLFDTNVYSQETNKKLKRYRNLVGISKNKRTNAQINELRQLAHELMSQQLPEVRESSLAEELRKFSEKYDL